MTKTVPSALAKERSVERGARLAALRRQAGLTQQEMADVVGVTQASISRIEAGKHGMTEAVKVRIADALGLAVHEVWPYLTLREATDSDSNADET